jgi:hypothetical protein
MNELFKIEQKGKGGKSRWNFWKYHVVNGLEVRANNEPGSALTVWTKTKWQHETEDSYNTARLRPIWTRL